MTINLENLKQVSSDPAFIREIADLFMGDVPAYISEIRSSSKSGHYEEMVRTLHKLKSAFGSMGIVNLHDSIGSFEENWQLLTPDERVSKLGIILQQVEQTFGVACKELELILSPT